MSKPLHMNISESINVLIAKSQHFNEVVKLSKYLKKSVEPQQEAELRNLEQAIKQTSLPLIIEAAIILGDRLIDNQRILTISSPQQAYFARYILVPLLYKLGFPQVAADLSQDSFHYLFPYIDLTIKQKLSTLFGGNIDKKYQYTQQQLCPPTTVHWQVYSRLKSNQSIWQKIKSLDNFQKMDITAFCQQVNDFIAMRWKIKPGSGENRYDALINGAKALPQQGLYKLRNQQLPQQSGFSAEPVLKALYIINNTPVELQILAGELEYYMSAKGYANYKVGFPLPPLESDMCQADWEARLGNCIYYKENQQQRAYHQLMLDELIGNNTQYSRARSYTPEIKPMKKANQTYRVPGTKALLYKTSSIELSEIKKLLSN